MVEAANSVVTLPELQVRQFNVEIVGSSPLIVHRWSEKAKKQLLDKQMKRAQPQKAAKDPQADFEESLYRTESGGYGFPAVAFKAATVRAGTYADFKMTYLKGAFHVPGELVEIVGEPKMREDMVRVGMGVADIRYRGEFREWSAVVPVDFNERAISLEQLLNLFKIAGFAVGVGEWRPEKDGQYGRFEVLGAGSR